MNLVLIKQTGKGCSAAGLGRAQAAPTHTPPVTHLEVTSETTEAVPARAGLRDDPANGGGRQQEVNSYAAARRMQKSSEHLRPKNGLRLLTTKIMTWKRQPGSV